MLRVLGLRMLRMQEVRRLELTDRSKSYKHPEPICGAEGIPPPPPPSHLCRLLFSPCSRLQGGSSWACQHPPRHPTPPPERKLCSQGSGGDGEEQVPLLTGGKGLETYSQESSRSLLCTLVTLPSVFLPNLFPFPHHLGHLTGHPVSHDMMYPGCVLSRVLLRVRGSSEHRWVEAKGRKKGGWGLYGAWVGS